MSFKEQLVHTPSSQLTFSFLSDTSTKQRKKQLITQSQQCPRLQRSKELKIEQRHCEVCDSDHLWLRGGSPVRKIRNNNNRLMRSITCCCWENERVLEREKSRTDKKNRRFGGLTPYLTLRNLAIDKSLIHLRDNFNRKLVNANSADINKIISICHLK